MSASDAPLDQQGEVHRAGFVTVEAVFERVAEAVEVEAVGTADVGAIEERTMTTLLLHEHTDGQTDGANHRLSAWCATKPERVLIVMWAGVLRAGAGEDGADADDQGEGHGGENGDRNHHAGVASG